MLSSELSYLDSSREIDRISQPISTVDDDFRNAVESGGERVENVVDKITGFGDEIRSAGDSYTDFLIDFATGLQNRAGETATENLKRSKINSFFSAAGEYVQNNIAAVAGAFAGLVVLILIVKRF